MTAELAIGDYVQCKKFGSLENDFAGEIEKVYENSVLVVIQDFKKVDEPVVNEYNHRAVVRKNEAKKKAQPKATEA